jgi:hypothetical protein
MRTEIVDQDSVSRQERRNIHSLTCRRSIRINRAIEHKGSGDAILAKGDNESSRFPIAVRYCGVNPLAKYAYFANAQVRRLRSVE